MSRIKYFFQPDRWRAFTIHLLRKLLARLDQSSYTPEVHEVEQFMYRYLKCADCMEAGTCVHSDCHCGMPARAHVRTDFCPTLKWGPMKPTAEEWKIFKKGSNVQFSLKEWALVEYLRKLYPHKQEISICSIHRDPIEGCDLCHLKLR